MSAIKLIRSDHFRKYIEEMYVTSMARTKGVEESVARASFNDTFYEDFNMLSWILPSTFPHTIREEDGYAFITDEMVHQDINVPDRNINVGRMTLRIRKDGRESIEFENKEFQHGQVRKEDGTVTCYGGFHSGFGDKLCDIGLSGALMEMYNFARVSDHNTSVGGVRWQ